MQLIIAPTSGENFLLDVPSTEISHLRTQVASRLSVPAQRVKLVAEGLELIDGATLADFYVNNLSTVRAVVMEPAASGAAEAAAAPAAAAVPGEESQHPVSDAEVPRSIVIAGIPSADPATTEKAIYALASRYGEVSRLIFQDTADASTAASHTSQQQAVVTFHREAAAAAALAADGTVLLGSPVRVMLAANAANAANAAMGSLPATGGSGAPLRKYPGGDMVAAMLARGYLYGVTGVAHVRRFDQEHQLTTRIRVVAESARETARELDRKYKVSEAIEGTYTMAKAQAQELDRQYRIRDTAESLATSALSKARAYAQLAMTHPKVAATVTAATTFISEAGRAVEGAILQTTADVGTRVEREQTDNAGYVFAAPGGHPASDAAPPDLPARRSSSAASGGASGASGPAAANAGKGEEPEELI